MRIEEKVIPARLECDKHPKGKACEGEVETFAIEIGAKVGVDGPWEAELCEKAYRDLVTAIESKLTPVTRTRRGKGKEPEPTE